jgi:myo-inositol-1(or 4)-monophosphatase
VRAARPRAEGQNGAGSRHFEEACTVDCPQWSAELHPREEREFVPFLHELIGQAFGVIQPLFLAGIEVQRKADATPVTLADRGAELALRRLIEQRYPDHGVVGEEFGARAGGRYRWILDPIDGTKAFISNCFLFGTLIALERDDGTGFRPVLGCIAHAAAGVALIGERRRTRLFRSDGSQREVRVRAPRALAQATVLCTAPPGSAEQGGAPGLARIVHEAALARTWGDCFGYFALATGGADAMLDPQLSYWDVAAVVPVAEGAGACLSSWRGGDPLRELSLIASSSPALHRELLERIRASGPSQ